MSINVRDMQRVPHRHTFGDRRNGRDVCHDCPYVAKRKTIISCFTDDNTVTNTTSNNTTPMNFSALFVDELRELVKKSRPNLKGVSKMRKADLVAALTD